MSFRPHLVAACCITSNTSSRIRQPTIDQPHWHISADFHLSYYRILLCKMKKSSQPEFTSWFPFGKAIPLQAWTGLEGSRRLRLPDFKTFGTWSWSSCQPYSPAAFTPRKYSWYTFLVEAESTPRPECGRKVYVNEKFQWHHRESNPRRSGL